MTYAPPSPWTPYRLDMLRELWEQTSLSAKGIAAKLGEDITRNAVIGKARRQGLKPRKSPIKRKQNFNSPNITIPAPRGCTKCRCGVYALPGLQKCYTCSERGSHA